jgi:hypothetical protein
MREASLPKSSPHDRFRSVYIRTQRSDMSSAIVAESRERATIVARHTVPQLVFAGPAQQSRALQPY